MDARTGYKRMSINPNSAKSHDGPFEAVHTFFAPRLICIAYCSYRAGAQPEFKIASGFIMLFDESPVLITAGHSCQEIYDMKQNGDLHGISLVYAKSKFNDESFDLDTDALPMFWWDDEDDLDIGFMFMESALLQRLVACGVKAIPAEAVSPPSDDPEKTRFAIGFSAKHTIVSNSEAF